MAVQLQLSVKANACLQGWKGSHGGPSVGRGWSQPEGCHWSRALPSWHPSYHHQIKPLGRAEGCLQRQQTWKLGGRRHQNHSCWHPGNRDGNIRCRMEENSSKFKDGFLQSVQRAQINKAKKMRITYHHRTSPAVEIQFWAIGSHIIALQFFCQDCIRFGKIQRLQTTPNVCCLRPISQIFYSDL